MRAEPSAYEGQRGQHIHQHRAFTHFSPFLLFLLLSPSYPLSLFLLLNILVRSSENRSWEVFTNISENFSDLVVNVLCLFLQGQCYIIYGQNFLSWMLRSLPFPFPPVIPHHNRSSPSTWGWGGRENRNSSKLILLLSCGSAEFISRIKKLLVTFMFFIMFFKLYAVTHVQVMKSILWVMTCIFKKRNGDLV